MKQNFLFIIICCLLLTGCLAEKESTLLVNNPSVVESNAVGEVHSPVWTKGDSWIWSDGYGLEVTETNPDGLTTFFRTDVRGCWYKRQGIFKQEEQSPTTHRKVIFRSNDVEKAIFPLEKGNSSVFQREFIANGQLRVHRTSWIVEQRETVTVPAGTFDCWVLTMRTRGVESGWTGYEKWWYSPAVKNYVRLEYRYGDAPTGVRVLSTYKVQ